jgi:hypothetical protein
LLAEIAAVVQGLGTVAGTEVSVNCFCPCSCKVVIKLLLPQAPLLRATVGLPGAIGGRTENA